MNRPCQKPHPQGERGFVLVTSLIFLVVITLLAVSAVNSSTLQERMASNLRDKSQARQAADAGLRQGELMFRNAAFDSYQPKGSTVALVGGNSSGALKLWDPRTLLGAASRNKATAFLGNALWTSDETPPRRYTLANGGDAVQFYVEDHDFISRDLNPDTAARADGGVIYRITARAQGQNPAAMAVTQSLYEKRY